MDLQPVRARASPRGSEPLPVGVVWEGGVAVGTTIHHVDDRPGILDPSLRAMTATPADPPSLVTNRT